MCHQNSCPQLASEEATAAEESLLIYCKPVELYNILHRRSLKNPSFLQRCLRYKRQEKRKRRLRMTISVLGTMAERLLGQNLFPLYVLLAKPAFDRKFGDSAVYYVSRVCRLTSFTESEGSNQAEVNFVLPEINKLSLDAKSGKLTILLVNCGRSDNAASEANFGGCCLLGNIPMDSLCKSMENSASLSLGHGAKIQLNVDMCSCILQPCCLEERTYITFQIPRNSETMGSSRKVQALISAKEAGADEKPFADSVRCGNGSQLPSIIRLRAGNVLFNYRDLNNRLRKTEVTEDFSCPFCLLQCASFKGLRYHLISSHDLFSFEFWVTEEYQAVNVSVKMDTLRSETVADGVHPRLLTFSFCSKTRKRKRNKKPIECGKHVHPLTYDSSSPTLMREGESNGYSEKVEGDETAMLLSSCKSLQNGRQDPDMSDSDHLCASDCIEYVGSSFNINGVSVSMPQTSLDPDYMQSVFGSDSTPSSTAPHPKIRKLSTERSDPRNRALLQKRQFFHSHRAQPMALDQVLSDRDSEDEVDDDIADFEDRRMLDDFVDVTKDEKQLMHLWNSFVRKQRVLADGHIPWACEAFSKLHGQELVQAPSLFWCWRLFMIKLWNHGLLDARTMNNCNVILEECRKGDSDGGKS